MVSVNALCLITFKDRNVAHTRIVKKFEPEQELHTLEFLGPLDLFCISKCHWCHTGRKLYRLLYEIKIRS